MQYTKSRVSINVEVAFKLDVSVLEPQDDYNYYGNSPFSMDDFKERKAPILAIDLTGEERWYSKCVNKEEIQAIFMGERFEDGIYTVIANVYYVIFVNSSDIAFKYEDICNEKYGIVSYDPYKKQTECRDYIDTIYAKDEYEGLVGKCHQ